MHETMSPVSQSRSRRIRAVTTGGALVCLAALYPVPAAAWRQTVAADLISQTGSPNTKCIASDASGDVFIASSNVPFGSSSALAKLAADTGAVSWQQAAPMGAMSVAVGSDGHVVVAGTSSEDLVLAKHDGTSGTELWRRQIDGPGGGDDQARTVTLTAGDEVVAGGYLSVGPSTSAASVIKLDGVTGAEVWRWTDVTGVERINEVRVDANGDVLAAGETPFVVFKIAGDTGVELWRSEAPSRLPPQPQGIAGAARALAVDSAGNVAVVGDQHESWSLLIVKLAGGTGLPLWQQTFDGLGYGYRFGRDVAIDAGDNVIVAGTLYLGYYDYWQWVIAKLDGATGEIVWSREAGGPGLDEARAVIVDTAGDVIAGGRASNGTPWNFAITKFAGTTGETVWRRMVTHDQSKYGGVVALTSDPAQDVIALGYVDPPDPDRTYVVKLSNRDGSAGLVGGTLLDVRDEAGNPAARSLKVTAKDELLGTPVQGSADDPTTAGATIRLTNPTTGESSELVLPAGSAFWKTTPAVLGPQAYQYRDPDGANGPCSQLSVAPGRNLRLRCSGRLGSIPFSLDEATQGSLTVSVRLGGAPSFCLVFGGTVLKDGGTANPGPKGRFKAKRARVLAGADCPPA